MRPWDNVDEASWESFPASDPPSWSAHRVVGNAEDKIDPVPPARHLWRLAAWLGGGAVVGAAAFTFWRVHGNPSR